MNTDVVIEVLNKEVSVSTPTMSLRTRKDIYSAATILNIPKVKVDEFLEDTKEGENFNTFIVIKEDDGPKLTWVKIGVSDLSNVEVINGLNSLIQNKQIGYIENTIMSDGIRKIKIQPQNQYNDIFAEVEKVSFQLINKLNLKVK